MEYRAYDWTDDVCCAIPPRQIGALLNLPLDLRSYLICCLPKYHGPDHEGFVMQVSGEKTTLKLSWTDERPIRLNAKPGS